MIWNSIPFMTAVDLLIIAVTIYAIWRCRLIGPNKRPSAPQIALRLIALGLLAVCLFYFADLASMYVLPAVTSMEEAMATMGTIHRNLSWLVVLFAMIAISAGFIELRRTQIELTEKNELLAQLSSKLAKFLPPQLYNSIFTGTHTTGVAAKRKKLTIFFSDIANFTETIDADHGDRSIGCLRHGVLLVFGAPFQFRSLAGQEQRPDHPINRPLDARSILGPAAFRITWDSRENGRLDCQTARSFVFANQQWRNLEPRPPLDCRVAPTGISKVCRSCTQEGGSP
jgi:hypothetical protein